MLNMAKEEAVDPVHKVKRLIKHGYKDAHYRICEGWRLVIVSGNLVTCERQNPDQN